MELESAIEQRRNEIKNYVPLVPVIGISITKGSTFKLDPKDAASDESVHNQDDDQSAVDMMEELEESRDSPLTERL